MTVRLVLAEDDLLVREGIRALLAGRPELEIVASCRDLASTVRAVVEHDPDVVLTDIRMPPAKSDEGIQLARRLRETHPRLGVVVLSNYDEPAYALALLEGRSGVSYEDIRNVALPVLRHRILVNFQAEAGGVDSYQIIARLLDAVRP